MTQFKVVSIGDFVCDYLMQVELPIQPNEVKFAKWSKLEPGGAANFCITSQRLGMNCSAIGVVGNDIYGNLILNTLREEKVDVRFAAQLPNSYTTVVLSIADTNKKGHAFVAATLGSAPYYPLTDEVRETIAQANAIYIQGYSMREEAIVSVIEQAYTIANKNNIPVYMDVGPLGNTLREERRRMVRSQTDVFSMTEEEMLAFTAQTDLDKGCAELLRAPHVKFVVVKRGDKGCKVVTRESVQDFPAYPIEARDAIGCGDSFNSAFIFSQLSGLPLDQSAKFANSVGAAKVNKIGPGRNMPHPQEIASVIKRFDVPLAYDPAKGLSLYQGPAEGAAKPAGEPSAQTSQPVPPPATPQAAAAAAAAPAAPAAPTTEQPAPQPATPQQSVPKELP
jgi:sugar/nucleoside kinase (ribokinase family)